MTSMGNTARSRSRVEEQAREHEKYEFELKDISQYQSASHILQGAISFLMPNEEHLCGFSQMGFHVKCCFYVSLIRVVCTNVKRMSKEESTIRVQI